MAYSSNHRSFSPFTRSSQSSHRFADDSSLIDDCLSFSKSSWYSLWRTWNTHGRRYALELAGRAGRQTLRNLSLKRLLSFPHLLVLCWAVVLLWGERWVFETSVEGCEWRHWERWPSEATPHHVLLLADPQLIDPHSYPGRPWPLSSLTFLITDNYLQRGYKSLTSNLGPDTIFFLGDLFDGGREWKTAHGKFEEPSWNHRPEDEKKHANSWKRKFGEDFWLREYARFGRIFFEPWTATVRTQESEEEQSRQRWQRGRKFIASLPGNHDLGFGSEVLPPVRDRFETHFGDVNRVDVVGNHTFVSIDSVSLSARTSEESGQADLSEIYGPTKAFLENIQVTKQRAVEKELRFWQENYENSLQQHSMIELAEGVKLDKAPATQSKADLPTIVLSHVPLYRPPGTPCGPMREHWPPSKPPKGSSETVLSVDHRNAISVSRGYQYQNVLCEEDSIDIISKIGPNVVHAFSGDDHDYCELTHADNQQNVKEITVKSMSMAMGVPTPGFLMVSLWNPVDKDGKTLMSTGAKLGEPTLQTHLCLLPSQLSTYARYGGFAFVTFVVLALRACLVPVLGLTPFALGPDRKGAGKRSRAGVWPTLPTFGGSSNGKVKVEDHDYSPKSRQGGFGYPASSTSSGNGNRHGSIARDRSSSLANPPLPKDGKFSTSSGFPSRHSSLKEKGARHITNGGGAGQLGWAEKGPKIQIKLDDDEDDSTDEDDDNSILASDPLGRSQGSFWKAARSSRRRGTGRRKANKVHVVLRELWTTCWRVLWMAAVFWGYLAYKG